MNTEWYNLQAKMCYISQLVEERPLILTHYAWNWIQKWWIVKKTTILIDPLIDFHDDSRARIHPRIQPCKVGKETVHAMHSECTRSILLPLY